MARKQYWAIRVNPKDLDKGNWELVDGKYATAVHAVDAMGGSHAPAGLGGSVTQELGTQKPLAMAALEELQDAWVSVWRTRRAARRTDASLEGAIRLRIQAAIDDGLAAKKEIIENLEGNQSFSDVLSWGEDALSRTQQAELAGHLLRRLAKAGDVLECLVTFRSFLVDRLLSGLYRPNSTCLLSNAVKIARGQSIGRFVQSVLDCGIADFAYRDERRAACDVEGISWREVVDAQ